MSKELQRAETRAADARRRLGDTIGALQAKLEPRHVVNEAVEKIADGGSRAIGAGIETARRHPGKLVGAVAAIAALLGRRRIAALFTQRDKFTQRDRATKPSANAGVQNRRPRPAPARRNDP